MQTKVWLNYYYYYYDSYYSQRKKSLSKKNTPKLMQTLEGWLVAAVFPPVNSGRKKDPF